MAPGPTSTNTAYSNGSSKTPIIGKNFTSGPGQLSRNEITLHWMIPRFKPKSMAVAVVL